MHSFLAGIMGFLMGITSIFYGGNATTPHANRPQTGQQLTVSDMPVPTGTMGGGFGPGSRGVKLLTGERPFFGTVTAVSGSTLTIQIQFFNRPFRNPLSTSSTPSTTQTLTINLDRSTLYTEGSQSDITPNIKIAGVGKVNSDGSITAAQIRINPTMPSRFPRRPEGQGNNQ